MTKIDSNELNYMDNNDTIRTIGELKEFLNKFNDNDILSGEYRKEFLGEFVNYEYRPLLKSLFEKNGNVVTLKAMIY
jgi:hypothetical protein